MGKNVPLRPMFGDLGLGKGQVPSGHVRASRLYSFHECRECPVARPAGGHDDAVEAELRLALEGLTQGDRHSLGSEVVGDLLDWHSLAVQGLACSRVSNQGFLARRP